MLENLKQQCQNAGLNIISLQACEVLTLIETIEQLQKEVSWLKVRTGTLTQKKNKV